MFSSPTRLTLWPALAFFYLTTTFTGSQIVFQSTRHLSVKSLSSARSSETASALPSGSGQIAFLSDEGVGGFLWAVFTINPDGTQKTRVTDHDDHQRSTYFAWSPDGTEIAFAEDNPFGRRVNVVNADGSGVTTISNGIPNAVQPAWSPDGSRVIFSSDNGLYVANVAGTSIQQLTSDPSDTLATWSPDGVQIAFVRGINNQARIFFMRPDGTNQTNITAGTVPQWSPTGSKLIFVRGSAGLKSDIIMMSNAGTNEINITQGQQFYSFSPKWSPDGNKIVFEGGDLNRPQIYVVNIDGSGLTALTNNSAQNKRPEWSPDGMKIAFISDLAVGGVFRIYSMKSDGSGQSQLTSGGNDYDLPKWQPTLNSTPSMQLIPEESGPSLTQTAAIDSPMLIRDPLPVVNTTNLVGSESDHNTRLMVFVTNLQLSQSETSSSVLVSLIGSNNLSYDIPAEDVRPVPNFNFSQVTFRLPDSLSVGTYLLTISAHGEVSNTGNIRISN